MNNYPKTVSITRMPNGTALEIVKVEVIRPGEITYIVRDKETSNILKPCNSFHRALGEVYGRVKAMEMKKLKAKEQEPKLCSNCQCMKGI